MKALTGMDFAAFTNLLPDFERELKLHAASKPNWQRKPGGGQKGHLKTAEDKLFFILFYLKTYPTFDVLAIFSSKSRGRSCEAAHIYLSISVSGKIPASRVCSTNIPTRSLLSGLVKASR